MKTRARAIAGSLVFFGVAPAIVAGWVPYTLTRWQVQDARLGHPIARVAGAALAAAGLAVLLDSFRRFAMEGRGTPAPIAPTGELIMTGLYRHVRNPMYLAVTTIVAGQALLFGSWTLLAYAAAVWLLFHVFVLAYEEPALAGRFGESYRTYRAQVGRWIPRRTPWPGPEARRGR